MKHVVVLLTLLAVGGCVQAGRQDTAASSAVAPTIVFKSSDSAYLLACINELQEIKQKDFHRYLKEAASRLERGEDRDTLKFVCLSLHPKAGNAQFKKGREVLKKYVAEHPDAGEDMQGLLVLFNRLAQAMTRSSSGRKKIQEERDKLAAEVESMQSEMKQDKGQIQELQHQIDQLKNIENIIKNREH